ESNGGRAARQDAGNLDAVLDRAALVGNRPAGCARRRVEPLQCVVIEFVADQRLRRLFDDDLRRSDRAEHDARFGAGAAGIKHDVDSATDDRDVHLGARDKAQIRIRLPRQRLRNAELDDKLALLQRGLPSAAAPISNLSPSSRMPMRAGIRFVSTITSGRTRPDFSWTRRSVPPDSAFATPALAANALTASSIDVGAV